MKDSFEFPIAKCGCSMIFECAKCGNKRRADMARKTAEWLAYSYANLESEA